MKNLRPFTLLVLGALAGAALTLLGLYFFLPPGAETITAALNDTMISDIHFDEASYQDAACIIVDHVRAAHPELRDLRLQFIPKKSTVPGSFPVTLKLRDVPAMEALRYVVNLANLEYAVRDGVLCVWPASADSSLPLTLVSAPTPPPPLTAQERLATNAVTFFKRARNAFGPDGEGP